MTIAPFLPGHLNAKQNFTAGARALASPTLAPPLHMGCWGGTTQNLGRIVPQLGAERPHLGRTWGGSTRGGSTEGRIDRYPTYSYNIDVIMCIYSPGGSPISHKIVALLIYCIMYSVIYSLTALCRLATYI